MTTPPATSVDPRILAAADKLKPALLDYALESAVEALSLYLSGASIDAVSRSTVIPRCRIDKWIKIAGVTRSRDEVKALQRRALDEVRHLAVAVQAKA